MNIKQNYRTRSLVNMNTKTLNKMLANEIQQDIKRIIYQIRFIAEFKIVLTSEYQ